jgi:hypothetical protein
MRAKEFLTEREYKDMISDPLAYTREFPSMPSSDPYLAYRFSLSMANHEAPVSGPASNHAVITTYTKEDDAIVKAAEKATGHKGKQLANQKMDEPKDTNVVSPVSKPKRNKYGV